MIHDGRRMEKPTRQVSVLKWWTHAITRHDCKPCQVLVRGHPLPVHHVGVHRYTQVGFLQTRHRAEWGVGGLFEFEW